MSFKWSVLQINCSPNEIDYLGGMIKSARLWTSESAPWWLMKSHSNSNETSFKWNLIQMKPHSNEMSLKLIVIQMKSITWEAWSRALVCEHLSLLRDGWWRARPLPASLGPSDRWLPSERPGFPRPQIHSQSLCCLK